MQNYYLFKANPRINFAKGKASVCYNYMVLGKWTVRNKFVFFYFSVGPSTTWKRRVDNLASWEGPFTIG